MTEEERNKLRTKYEITAEDEDPFVMPQERDYAILAKVKELESKELNEQDKETVDLIRFQLIDDWRQPLLNKLSRLLEKYR